MGTCSGGFPKPKDFDFKKNNKIMFLLITIKKIEFGSCSTSLFT